MKRPNLSASLALAALAAVAYGCARAEAQALATPTGKAAADPGRGPIELTVYAGDFAMVRETRRVDLQAGRARVGLLDVSKSLDQNSVVFGWPKGQDAKVVSSTYDLGTRDSGHLLSRFLGKPVDLVYRGQDGREGERVRGILEVADPGNVVVRADGKYIVNPSATIEAPADAGIVTIPQLSAEVESPKGGATDLSVAYMTGGLSWDADYTLTLSPDKDELGLECWATVTNRTGTDYPDASLRFVAGSPNRAVRERQQPQDYEARAAGGFGMKAVPPAAQMNGAFNAPQAMGELIAYPYKSTATIKQDQTNRVRMMGSDAVRVRRVYSVALPEIERDYSNFNANPDARINATMGINFQNAKGSGLGLPLPGGTVRVYEPDAGGAARYVGAATMGDTPKDANVSLELTSSFDVYAHARQVSAQRVDKRHTRRTVEVTVFNEKARTTEVRLVESLGNAWRMESETAKGTKLNASTDQWTLSVPAGGKATLRYTALFGG